MVRPMGERKNSRLRPARWILPPILSLILSCGVIGMLWVRFPSFVPYDDGLNEFVPYVREIGRMLQSGELPILTARSFSGGNLLVDFGRAPFHPVTLLTAAIDLGFHNLQLTAAAFAVLAMTLTVLGGWFLSRTLGLGWRSSAVIGLTVGTSPVFLYLYATNWWNGALGTSGFLWATGALVWALHRTTTWRLVLLALMTTTLFLSGWPHGIVAFALVVVVTAVFVLTDSGGGSHWTFRLVRLIAPGIAVLLGALIALPQLSEFLTIGGFLDRSSSIENLANRGIPTVAQVIGAPFPSGSDWWSFVGDYDYWRIPLGFVSLVGIVALFFIRWSRALLADRVLRWALVLAASFALATQLPAHFGPLLFPFRFLPIAGAFLVISVVRVIGKGEPAWSRRRFMVAAMTFAVGTAYFGMRIPAVRHDIPFILATLLLVVVVVAFLWLLRSPRHRRLVLVALAGGGTAFMLVTSIPPSEKVIQWPPVPAAINDLPASNSGFVLSIGDRDRGDNDIWPGYLSARYLLAGASVTNGYDPVGQVAYRRAMADRDAHGFLSSRALDYLTRNGSTGTGCILDDWRVTAVVTYSDPELGRHAGLLACGFAETATRGDASLFEHPRAVSTGTLSTTSPDIQVGESTGVDLSEKARVSNRSSQPGTVAFARMWWPGYTATLDGQPLQVSTPDGVSLQTTIPANSAGLLELRYWPSSWVWALPLSGLAAISVALLGAIIGVRSRRVSGQSESGAGYSEAPGSEAA